jgi:hypothetical protein
MKSHDSSNRSPNQSTNLENDALASTDFDRWARAVRRQMLDCLKKRHEHS